MENSSYLTEIKARLTYRQAYVHVKNPWGGGGHENSRFSVNIYSVPLKFCALYFYNHQPTTHQMFPSIVISPPTWYTITQWCMPNFCGL